MTWGISILLLLISVGLVCAEFVYPDVHRDDTVENLHGTQVKSVDDKGIYLLLKMHFFSCQTLTDGWKIQTAMKRRSSSLTRTS